MGCAENGHTANSICDNKKFDNGNGYRQSKWLHKYIFANVYLITILQNMENTNIGKQKDFHADKLKSPGLDSNPAELLFIVLVSWPPRHSSCNSS